MPYYITEEQFHKLYYEDKLTYKQIAELIGYPYDIANFSRMVRRLGWKKELGKVDRYFSDSTFFYSLNRESAWVLGWLVTDGYIHNEYVDLTVHARDEDVIHKVKSLLKFDGPYYTSIENAIGIRMYNRDLVKSISKLGIPIENKTFNCVFPEVPDECLWDFIRGAVEGDGSIRASDTLQVKFFSASKQFAEKMHEILTQKGIETSFTITEPDGKKLKHCIYSIVSKNMPSALRWAYFMYNNTTNSTRLDRKFNYFADFVRCFYDKKRVNRDAIEWVEIIRKNIPECNPDNDLTMCTKPFLKLKETA